MAKIDDVKKGVDELRERLLIKEPADFSMRDLISAFFGALLLGITFAVKGLLIEVSSALDNTHLALIVGSTLLILTAEIYFIGYSRVGKKSKRKFGQFWLKRLVVFYFVAVITSVFLVYLFGLNKLSEVGVNNLGVLKLVVLISLPCAIGAAIADLLNKY
ncbi:DUF2391 family protein [Candidatus Woesearchaeota archaeon]|nr:DUF2391 family protein [Candidatus Woesearchaeota archaeon]